MLLDTSNTGPNIKAHWAPIIAAAIGVWTYFSPYLSSLVATHPSVTIWIALGTAIVTFYSTSSYAVKSPSGAPAVPSVVPVPQACSNCCCCCSVPPVVVPPVVVPPVLQKLSVYASEAGFSGPNLVTAVAIAFAESNGNPQAIGDVTLGGSYGLWQINLRAHPLYHAVSLMDPQYNADAAFQVYTEANNKFTPWTTFNNGAYKAHLARARADVGV